MKDELYEAEIIITDICKGLSIERNGDTFTIKFKDILGGTVILRAKDLEIVVEKDDENE